MLVISKVFFFVFRTVLVSFRSILDRFRPTFFIFSSSTSSQHHFRKELRNTFKNIPKIFKHFSKTSFVAFIFSADGSALD